MINHFGEKPQYAVGDKVLVAFFSFIGSIGVITDIKVEGDGFRYLVDNLFDNGRIIVDWYGAINLSKYEDVVNE